MNGQEKIIGRNINKTDIPLVAILYSKGKEKQAVNKFHKYVFENNLNERESRIIVRNNSLKNKLLGMKSNNQSSNNLETIAQVVYLLNRENQVSDFRMLFDLLAKSTQRTFLKQVSI